MYFDNDEAGNRAVEILKMNGKYERFLEFLYSKILKDLNEWAMSSAKLEEKTQWFFSAKSTQSLQ